MSKVSEPNPLNQKRHWMIGAGAESVAKLANRVFKEGLMALHGFWMALQSTMLPWTE